ncbi:MAG: extracellular solute-binding protein, partial [Lachnospiraceae bacterium]|nr:extracellular solute-binding protein [Lachnospiraceae bacterium]
MRKESRQLAILLLAGALLTGVPACGKKPHTDENLITNSGDDKRVVNMFTPMEKSNPNAENSARTAQELTVIAAEKALGVQVEYRTYTAENYQEKTYDEVLMDRVRSNMDDIYLLNPDTLLLLGSEGQLADLSGLENAKNLRDVVRVANTVDGKLLGIPQEVVAYGLFVNKD